MSENMFPGQWKQNDKGHFFVISIPVAKRADVKVIKVEAARGTILSIEPSAFYVVIPASVREADQWRVYVKNGALKVRPPKIETGNVTFINKGNSHVGMQAAVVYGDVTIGRGGSMSEVTITPVTIGFVLPRQIPFI